MKKINFSFIFQEGGFYLDTSESIDPDQIEFWQNSGGYPALYHTSLNNEFEFTTPSGKFLRDTASAFFDALTDLPELELIRENASPVPSSAILDRLLSQIPFSVGSEYIDADWIGNIFSELSKVFGDEINAYNGTVKMYLAEKSQNLRVPERIFFHLVENRKDEAFPFAFLATYASKTADSDEISHVPLSYALTEFNGQREKLLELLACLNRVADISPMLGELIDSGELFHPMKFTSDEAYSFLCSIEELEKIGIICRIPAWWNSNRSQISKVMKIGENKPSELGFDALISMQPELLIDGIKLTEDDVKDLLAQSEGLAFFKGKWVEVNHKRLNSLLAEMGENSSLTLMEALRMEALGSKDADSDLDGETLINHGSWLSEFFTRLRQPETLKKVKPPKTLHATLRPYQISGYNWLREMDKFGFGACLADDMGLGKTLQVLTYLDKMRQENKSAKSLLIVPASLIDNWQKEAARFAPSIRLQILHGKPSAVLEEEFDPDACLLSITTYGMAMRIAKLKDIHWDCLILDEAQAIKNPGTKQTRAIKSIPAKMRIALTGTPIENDLSNLWSLFDFLNKGLLGTSAEFKDFSKRLDSSPGDYSKLRNMISPFLLRRMKTDKSIISDLPDKIEISDHTELAPKQVVLYRKAVSEMEHRIMNADSAMDRRGQVLATIMKLKQICNHPDQFLGQTSFAPAHSGKFTMLKDICETIYEKRERVLVFTQFREMCEPLAQYLSKLFHVEGCVLHGSTPVKERAALVEKFQSDTYVPFMVLSVKAGGTGLNLTRASHVIHFDRWWNPAVENQATDRAFRIGQKNNVMVHKLISTGTIEEKIDKIIESKKELANSVIGSGGEKWITEMSDNELHELFRLEI